MAQQKHGKGKLLFSYFTVFVRQFNVPAKDRMISSIITTFGDEYIYIILNEFYNTYCGGIIPTPEQYKNYSIDVEMLNGEKNNKIIRNIFVDPGCGLLYMMVDGEKRTIISNEMKVCFNIGSCTDANGEKFYDVGKSMEYASKHYFGKPNMMSADDAEGVEIVEMTEQKT